VSPRDLSKVALPEPTRGGQFAALIRLAGPVVLPTALHMVSYAVIMMLLGWALAFGLEHGVTGLLLAIAIASFASLTVLSARFGWIAHALRAQWSRL